MIIQKDIITPADRYLRYFSFGRSFLALFLDSIHISLGIIFFTKSIQNGINMRSSRYQKKGMKSGIRSIGLKKYPMIARIRILTNIGVFGFL
jgi:hypothetical protein